MAKLLGIDVSHWQKGIDWNKVKGAEITWAILKVSQGSTYKDSCFEEYYEQARSCKIALGAYIYNKVKSVAEAKKEAEFAVKVLAGRELPLGVWLDMEDSTMKNLGKDTLNAIIKTEADIIKAAGYEVNIYCNKYWHDSVLDSASLQKEYKFWIARYPLMDNGTLKENLILPYMDIYQYSSKGKVQGISGNVDMDVIFDDEIAGWVSRYVSGVTVDAPVASDGGISNTNSNVPFLVKIIDDNLNIRKGPGTTYQKTGYQICDHGIYTIVEVEGNWGRLKSGAGWICIKNKYVKRV